MMLDLSQFDTDTLVLTAGRRLSRALLAADDRARLARGETVWESPQVLPWGSWLLRCWNAALPANDDNRPMVLTDLQEQVVWERAITGSGDQVLLQPAAAARLAREAWTLMQDWGLPLPGGADLDNPDVAAFHRWAWRYRSACEAGGWLDGARLASVVEVLIREGTVSLPRRMVLAGFDELNPRQQAVLAAAAARGVAVEHAPQPAHAADARRVACGNARAEFEAAARWARRHLERDAGLRVAIVVPNLAEHRAVIERVFDEALAPARLVLTDGASPARAWNISLGTPLAKQAVVQAALGVLRLVVQRVALDEMGALLRGPYLAGADEELSRRALLDARLRRNGVSTAGLAQLRRLAARGLAENEPAAFACPLLVRSIDALLERQRAMSSRLPPSRWAEHFSAWLALAGWPGSRAPDSSEFQAIAAFQELLPRLSALDDVSAALGARDALRYLHRLADDSVFQPETPEVPVQILGVLEAAGLAFDHLWVTGMHDGNWPLAPRPNPFLPVRLQRSHGAPHASAERELAFCEAALRRLCTSAGDVVISYPMQQEDRDLLPSALIHDFPETDVTAVAGDSADTVATVLHRRRAREEVENGFAPALPAGARVQGGASLFKHQASCPFRAFAETRLHARAMEEAQTGLDAAARGTLVHTALEHFWRGADSHAALCNLDTHALGVAVTAAADHALTEAARQWPEILTPGFVSLERRRLERVLTEWVTLEKQRAPFTVRQREHEEFIDVGDIVVRTVIDRIDELHDGSTLVIDYKTGRVSVGDWMEPRPKEPQLPLYGIHAGARLGGLAFARVRPGEAAFVGITVDAVLPGVKPFAEDRKLVEGFGSWSALLACWRKIMEGLARDYRNGDARVDPRKYPDACEYCGLTPLCRIHERHARIGRVDLEEERHHD